MSDAIITASIPRLSSQEFATAPRREVQGEQSNRAAAQETKRSGKQGAPTVETVSKDSVKLVTDEESGRSYVQILDRDTGEVMYQIPPEEVHKLSEILKEMTGAVVDTMA